MAVVKWKMPFSKDRTEPQATPVPSTMVTASRARTVRATGRARVTAVTSVSSGTSSGYWPDGRIPGSRNRRARLVIVSNRMVITGAGGQVGRFLAAQAARQGYGVCALTHREFDITDPAAAVAAIVVWLGSLFRRRTKP